MWLLNAHTHELEWYYDHDAIRKGYAILSHTWGDEEVTFAEMNDLDRARSKKGYQEIEYTCRQALRDGYDYAWVDTCYIKKSSGAEFSEPIQSMFRWYEESKVCYAYLPDVIITGIGWDQEELSKSRWFTRGWTLQELIASARMAFFGKHWKTIRSKESLLHLLATITDIGREYLIQPDCLNHASVAARMCWAAGRETTRPEDRAYSLMGIFLVNIPLLYGEGARAFQRLPEEILKTSSDHFILLGSVTQFFRSNDLFAHSPDNFAGCGKIQRRRTVNKALSNMTNVDLQLSIPVARHAGEDFVVLNCRYDNESPGPIGLPIERQTDPPLESYSLVILKFHFSVQGERFTVLQLRKNEDLNHYYFARIR